MNPVTLVTDLVVDQVERIPDAAYVRFLGRETLTYATFWSRCRTAARQLAQSGVSRGDRVLLVLPNGPEFLVQYLATLSLGAIAVPIAGRMPPLKAQTLAEHCTPTAVVTNRPDIAERVRDARWTTLQVSTANTQSSSGPCAAANEGSLPPTAAGGPAKLSAPGVIDLDPATIFYTSGSTGSPKGILATHLNMVSAVRSIQAYLQLRADDVILQALPPFFDYGLYQALLAAHAGATVAVAGEGLMVDEVPARRSASTKRPSCPLCPP